MRRLMPVLVVVLVIALAACSSKSAPSASAPVIRWTGTSTSANGPAGPIDVATVCGSSTETYLLELQHHAPTALKVLQEWGDVTPGGRQVLVSGTVATVHQGPGDLPIDHPLGDDLSMDVTVDPGFAAFSQKLGTAPTDVKPGDMHVEISSGFIPHVPRASSAAPGQSWPDLSGYNLTGFQPGFAHPEVGDQVLVAGRYIVDCGHPDYHTELHPISFIAWTHRSGSTTVASFYANGYRDSEYYSPDAASVGNASNPSRITDKSAARFPQYLITQVSRLVSGAIPQLQSFELVGSVAPPSVSWRVCAAGSGGKTQMAYDVRHRPGVAVEISSRPAGCADIRVDIPRDYSSPDIPARTCGASWAYISHVAGEALAGNFDARTLINGFLPPKYAPLVDRDPVVGCADALSGPPVSAAPSGTLSQVDPGQPFPVYGTVTLSRS